MYRDTLPSRQLGIWLASLSPVAIQLAASEGWRTAAITGGICILAAWAVWRWGSFGRWVSVGAYILLTIAVGQLLRESAVMWSGNSDPWVPLLLLGLALWSAIKGASAAARVGCVLFWAMLIIYPLVFGAALRDLNWEWAVAEGRPSGGQLSLLLLLLGVGKILLKNGRTPIVGVLPVIFGLAGTILTLGLRCNDFYELSKSIALFGAVKHFEAVVFAAATVGWFLLLSYGLTLCGGLGEGRPSVVMGALVMAAWMLCDMHIQYNVLLFFGAIFWVAMPILAQVVGVQKKMKKSGKTS